VKRYVCYLHGFASSVQSTKAQYFAARLARSGVEMVCPDLNEPDFAGLTVTRMLDQVEGALDRVGPAHVALVGSSLGGLVAFLAASRQCDARRGRGPAWRPAARIDRLVLLAPALDFLRGPSSLGDAAAFERWRSTGTLDVYHHGQEKMVPVGFSLFEDAQHHDAFGAEVPLPTMIFQGRADSVVDPSMVERFAGSRPYVSLRLLDDDHRLTESLGLIWQESKAFLGIAFG
jgi:pimeloyl-ACP methyl ester carboxylesterase